MPRGLVATARSGGHCPLRVSGGILSSERGQSRDAFQAIPLEETSPRCNKFKKPGTCTNWPELFRVNLFDDVNGHIVDTCMLLFSRILLIIEYYAYCVKFTNNQL